jgi:two-component system chemotaxis sensor kinase CheA
MQDHDKLMELIEQAASSANMLSPADFSELDKLQTILDQINKNISESSEIFRAFHTIKGMAGFLNLGEIGSLAYSAENLLDLARKDKLKLEDKTIDIVSGSLDMLKNMITELTKLDKTSKAVSQQKNLPQMLEKLKSLSLTSFEQA